MLDSRTLAIHQMQERIKELEALIEYSDKHSSPGNKSRKKLLKQLKEELELAKGVYV